MTKEENTLKPCPFCGSEAWANCRKADGQYCIECDNCGAAGPTSRTEKDRDWEWNRRGPRVCVDDDRENRQGLGQLRALYESIERYIMRLESYCQALELDNEVLREAYDELREELGEE